MAGLPEWVGAMTFAVNPNETVRVAVVTTFSPRGYEVYGRRFIDTFAKYWPDGPVRLFIYYEGEKPSDAVPWADWRCLDNDADRTKFMVRFQDPTDHVWDYTKGIVKYSHKVWAMTSVPRSYERIFFFDGDTETVAPVTMDYLDSLMPRGYVASYLGRHRRHSETGFLGFSTRDKGDDFLRDFRLVYKKGDIAKLPAWHDCAAFDFMREMYEEAGYKFLNLSEGCEGLDAFGQSPLDACFQHNKGPGGKHKAYGTGEHELV
jgi:hypothetical protein